MFKVLLVDDEPSVINGLKNIIPWNELGYDVTGSAYNGEDGLNTVRELLPDLVITDIKMPVFDGLELIKRVIHEVKAEVRFIILSGYDEFSYVKEALKHNVKDYILKPVDEDELIPLLKKLHKQMTDELAIKKERELELKFIANETINRLLIGELKDSLLNRARLVLGLSEESWFRIVLLEIEDLKEWMSGCSGEAVHKKRECVFFHIKACLHTDHVYYLHDEELDRFVAFITNEIDDTKELMNMFEFIRNEIKLCCGLTVSLFASEKHKSVENASKAYKETQQAHDYRFYNGRGCIIFSENINTSAISYTITDAFQLDSILEDIEAGNLNQMNIKIEAVFQEFENKTKAPEVISVLISSLQLSIARLIVTMNGNADEFVKKEKIFSYDIDRITLSELSNNVKSFCESSSLYITSLRKRNSAHVVNEITEFINKNYRSDISLKQLASQFYMNSFYLGQLFKKITGMYFNDYLNFVRIEEAKRLLRRTNLKIYEVAAEVGYSDTDYFFSRFEKLNHISPLKYKKSILNKSDNNAE